MGKCVYTKIQDGDPAIWETACGKQVRCEAPMEVGLGFPPLPNEHGKFCSNCGGKIVLKVSPIIKQREEEAGRRAMDSMCDSYTKVKLLHDMKGCAKTAEEVRMLDEMMDEVDMFEAAAIREGRPPMWKGL